MELQLPRIDDKEKDGFTIELESINKTAIQPFSIVQEEYGNYTLVMDGNSTTDDYVGVYEATLVVTDTSVGK